MGKKERTLLNGEIEIPETVQKKADLAFSRIKNERVVNMEQNISNNQDSQKKAKRGKMIRRICAAVTACAALVVAAGSWHAGQPVEPSEFAAQDGEKHSETISKPFMLTAKAAETGERIEMTKGKPVAITTEDADSWVLGGNEDGTWSYWQPPTYNEGPRKRQQSRSTADRSVVAMMKQRTKPFLQLSIIIRNIRWTMTGRNRMQRG